ncbi:MAG: ABC transporter ATP-binding protein/permease [Candidatus Eremiobacteraeota bacterium]|nr:ABC transporter ATP-binding protein/permease [Candidatus Eremiobacteraeota bacterium]
MTRSQTLARIGREARPYIGTIALAMLFGAIGGTLTTLAVPKGAGILLGEVITTRQPDQHLEYLALGLIAGAMIVGALATYGNSYLMAYSGQHLIAKLRVRLFSRVLSLPLGEFDKWRPGELISRFNSDLQLMTEVVTVSVPQLFQNTITFIAALTRMLTIDWFLCLVLFAIAPLLSYVVSVFNKLITAGAGQSQQRIADLSANLTEVLHGQRIVKAFGREDFEVDRFRRRNNDFFGAYMKVTQFINTQPLVLQIVTVFGIVGVMWLTVREVSAGRLNSAGAFEFFTLMALLINPMNRFAAFFGEIAKALVGAGRIYEVIDLAPEPPGPPDAVRLEGVRGRIVFEEVGFAYDEGEPVLSDFSAAVEAGEIVALVGPSGAGKTTIVNLVPRFYEPQSGRITLDGADLSKLRLADLRRAIAIVPQEPLLFRGSVAENIRYGRLDATPDEIRNAAREANADEFVNGLPEGYDTEVGERGNRLSGGQRQRISIARAILRDPRILILDEATSALDSHSEALIEEALDRLLPGRTTLIIAHRLSTIRRAHKILYIEGGRVLEAGSHERLLAAGGAYARLHATQFAAISKS